MEDFTDSHTVCQMCGQDAESLQPLDLAEGQFTGQVKQACSDCVRRFEEGP
jgi:hypothetical protein